MEAKDLMIWDWVRYKDDYPSKLKAGTTVQIVGVKAPWVYVKFDESDPHEEHYSSVEPIPITPEILEKNGFVKRSDRDDKLGNMEYYQFEDYGFVYHYSNGEWEIRLQNTQEYRLFSGYLNNVNELQHVLNILNIEKEIKL